MDHYPGGGSYGMGLRDLYKSDRDATEQNGKGCGDHG